MSRQDERLAELAKFYNNRAAVLAELEYLRMRWPRLDTKAQRDQNLQDRADLNRLLLVMP